MLARWLDHHCRADDLRQPQLLEFVRRVVADQLGHKRVPLGALVYFKYRLAKAIVRKLGEYRAQAREEGYQAQLFTAQAQVETSFDYSFRFSADDYPARNYYRGSYTFQHHYYGAHRVGELKEQGEEFDCARALDMQPGIEYWVRNLDSRPGSAFRLPLSKGWFYPDFVALLRDGRVLVVEYKGAQLIDKVSEREKANVGALWEAKSHGRALFLMAVKEKEGMGVYEQIQAKIGLADG